MKGRIRARFQEHAVVRSTRTRQTGRRAALVYRQVAGHRDAREALPPIGRDHRSVGPLNAVSSAGVNASSGRLQHPLFLSTLRLAPDRARTTAVHGPLLVGGAVFTSGVYTFLFCIWRGPRKFPRAHVESIRNAIVRDPIKNARHLVYGQRASQRVPRVVRGRAIRP
ncbi:hypothetical protein MRX96_028559 [Rhipicephalus microplus]